MRVIVHTPTTDTLQQELARRVAEVHAQTVLSQVQQLTCSQKQKLALVDSMIAQSK